jgi:hypothetical protein
VTLVDSVGVKWGTGALLEVKDEDRGETLKLGFKDCVSILGVENDLDCMGDEDRCSST